MALALIFDVTIWSILLMEQLPHMSGEYSMRVYYIYMYVCYNMLRCKISIICMGCHVKVMFSLNEVE